MSGPVIVALVLGVAALAFVAKPLFRTERASDEDSSDTLSLARELQAKREQLVSSLRDLEDDHETDKIDDEDYRSLHDQLSSQAVRIMRRLDELEAERDREDEAARRSKQPLRHPALDRPDSSA